MISSIVTHDEFLALREEHKNKKEFKQRFHVSPERLTEREEMDVLAGVLEHLSKPPKKFSELSIDELTISKNTWEENPIAAIFRHTANFLGFKLEENVIGQVIRITIRKRRPPSIVDIATGKKLRLDEENE